MGYLAGALLWHSICVSDDVFIPARLFLRSLEICDAKIQAEYILPNNLFFIFFLD